MLMQKIRRSTQNNRKILLIIVAILAVGLVGSFAVWNSGDYNKNAGVTATTEDQISMYEKYIADTTPADGAMDYDTASKLANYYSQLVTLYNTAYNEKLAASDASGAAEYQQKAANAAGKAAEYYQFQLDNRPENMNDYAIALLMGSRAQMLSLTGDMDTARDLYQQAMGMSPENIDVAEKYVGFIYSQDGLEAAQAYAAEYQAAAGEGSDNYNSMAQIIAYYEYIDQIYNTTGDVLDEEAAAANGGTDAESGNGGENTEEAAAE